MARLGRFRSPVTPRHIAWQAWHLVTSTFVSRGRRGTWSHPPSSGGALGPELVAGDAAALCVAGMALGVIHLRFAWQAWHLVTSSFVLRGKCGTYGTGQALVARWAGLVAGDAAAFCVAGVALGDIHLCFAWQAWHLVTSNIVLRGRRGAYGTGLALVARLGRICQHHLLHTLSHIIFHTQLCHPPSLTHHLSHTTFSHTIFHTPSLTHYFVTPSFTHHP